MNDPDKLTCLSQLKKLLSKELGFTVQSVSIGCRPDRYKPSEWTYNSFCWDQDENDSDVHDVTTYMIHNEISPYRWHGMALDLYVYNKEELVTNVTVVLSYHGIILALYDSVSDFGMECDEWWRQGFRHD